MIINSSIAEHYFKERTVEDIKNHWIFNSIENNQCLCENPPKENYERLKRIHDLLLESLEGFKPWNIELWKEFFGDYDYNNNDAIVYITVGVPAPYDAMVLKDENGTDCIILDLERIRFYSEDDKKIIEIMDGLITHEMAHINIHKIYPWPMNEDRLEILLKYITFNEGIAHFLSIEENVLDMEWNSEEMIDRKNKSYKTLLSYINNKDNKNIEEILSKATCGRYWDKFACIAGIFALVDHYNLHNKDIKSFGEVYKKGIDELFNVILSNRSKSV